MDQATTRLEAEPSEVVLEIRDLLKEIRDLLKKQNEMEYGVDTGLMP